MLFDVRIKKGGEWVCFFPQYDRSDETQYKILEPIERYNHLSLTGVIKNNDVLSGDVPISY